MKFKTRCPVLWLPFLGSWIINEFENLGKREKALGKQNLRIICPRGKVEFKYFSSPVWEHWRETSGLIAVTPLLSLLPAAVLSPPTPLPQH